MASSVAAGADAVLFGEQHRSDGEVVDEVESVVRDAFASDRGKRRVLIIKAEAVAIPCTRLVELVDARLADLANVECRAIVLGHLVRGGSPSYLDRLIAGRLGLSALLVLVDGGNDEMVAWHPTCAGATATPDPNVGRFPLESVLAETDAMLEGTTDVVQRRMRMMEAIEGVLAL